VLYSSSYLTTHTCSDILAISVDIRYQISVFVQNERIIMHTENIFISAEPDIIG